MGNSSFTLIVSMEHSLNQLVHITMFLRVIVCTVRFPSAVRCFVAFSSAKTFIFNVGAAHEARSGSNTLLSDHPYFSSNYYHNTPVFISLFGRHS